MGVELKVKASVNDICAHGQSLATRVCCYPQQVRPWTPRTFTHTTELITKAEHAR